MKLLEVALEEIILESFNPPLIPPAMISESDELKLALLPRIKQSFINVEFSANPTFSFFDSFFFFFFFCFEIIFYDIPTNAAKIWLMLEEVNCALFMEIDLNVELFALPTDVPK